MRQRETLAIRWCTPRGKVAREAVLRNLRDEGGADLAEILEPMRRDGVAKGYLDLRAIDLSGEDLRRANLLNVDFAGARLDGCRLSAANLQHSNFFNASLARADLRGASLSYADMTGANLTDADLSDALMECTLVDGARMTRTLLKGTRTYRMSLVKAALKDVDLSAVEYDRPATPPKKKRSRTRRAPRPERARTQARTRRLPRPELPATSAEPSTRAFDEALATLLQTRHLTEEIRVVIGGEEVLLYAPERRAA